MCVCMCVCVCVLAVTVALTHRAAVGIKQSGSMRHCKQLEQLRGALIGYLPVGPWSLSLPPPLLLPLPLLLLLLLQGKLNCY